MTAGFAETGPGGPVEQRAAGEPDRPGPHPPRLERPTSAWSAPGYATGAMPPVGSPPPTGALPAGPPPPRARRSPLVAILVGVLAVLVVAQAAFLVVLQQQLSSAN